MALYHVTYGSRKKLVKLQEYRPESLRKSLTGAFDIDKEAKFIVQLYNKDFEDWVDVDIEDATLSDGGKLNITLSDASTGAASCSKEPLAVLNELPTSSAAMPPKTEESGDVPEPTSTNSPSATR